MDVPEWVTKHRTLTAVAAALAFLVAGFPVWFARLWPLFSTRDFASLMGQSAWAGILMGPLYGWFSVIIGVVLVVLAFLAVFTPPPLPPLPPRPRDVVPRAREAAPRRREETAAPPVALAGGDRLLNLQRPEPEKPSRVGSAEWQKLAEDFRRIRDSAVRADWTRSPTGDSWKICGGMMLSNKDCEALCRTAGIMLLTSPNVGSVLSPLVKAETTPAWRWLRYVRDVTASFESDLERGPMDGGLTSSGSIEDLTGLSARLCAECSALESVLG